MLKCYFNKIVKQPTSSPAHLFAIGGRRNFLKLPWGQGWESNFIKVTLRHECSSNLLHISKTSFLKNTSEELPLVVET